MKKLTISHKDLEEAFELGDFESAAYLDVETGAVIIIMDETNTVLEQFVSEDDDLAAVLSKLSGDETLSDWERQMLIPVAEVKFSDNLDRYKTIPRPDSREGYQDMQKYIWTLDDGHLRELLESAIQGAGGFRRFKDALTRYPEARRAWFSFRDARLNERMVNWLKSQGIEAEFE